MNGNKPVEMELEAGTYYWCDCGLRGTEPFCDGAHKASGKAPVQFAVGRLSMARNSIRP